ncbi:hypothetical protein KO02_12225 [Sphingobacterium sp. ML3W]|uniref:hypothetical protein n=1 Tax=Sphingobacterium sp. ML3W TaxID=1538644 RepID=UPI0004F7669A|nr:hypothetical protein [Sphingobacterium sp. ML3W]AIM37372.1 hypothetical protein KO02_12225 [Sphingobacterium sp. ML3W]
MNEGIIEGMMGNATGQIGQGLAYVLPETKSDKFFLQQSIESRDNMYKQLLQQDKMRQERSALIDKTIRDKYNSPDNWTPFNNTVRDKWGAWNQEAVALKAKGIDPTNDPNMLKKYDEITRTAKYSNDLKEQYVRLQNAMLNNPDKYDGIEMKRVQDEYDELMRNPTTWYDQGKRFSNMKAKDPSFDDLLKGMKGAELKNNDGTWETVAADINGNKSQVLAKIMADPQKWTGPAMQQFGVNTGVLPYFMGDNIPTDDASIRKMTEGIMNSSSKEAFLEKANIANDDHAGERLYEEITKTNKGYDNMISTLASGLNAGVGSGKKRVYEGERVQLAREAGSRANQSLAISQERLALAKDRAVKDDKKEDTRDKFVQGVQDWNTEALRRFDSALFEIEVGGKQASRTLSRDGKQMIVRVPVKSKDKVGNEIVTYKDYKFTKGVKNENGKQMINQILNKSKVFGNEKSLKVTPYDDEDDLSLGSADDL